MALPIVNVYAEQLVPISASIPWLILRLIRRLPHTPLQL